MVDTSFIWAVRLPVFLSAYRRYGFYAKWTVNQYTLYNTNVEVRICDLPGYQTRYTPPAPKSGHSFIGWSQAIPEHMPSEVLSSRPYGPLISIRYHSTRTVEVQYQQSHKIIKHRLHRHPAPQKWDIHLMAGLKRFRSKCLRKVLSSRPYGPLISIRYHLTRMAEARYLRSRKII